MRVHLEFLGLSRIAAGTREVVLELHDSATYREIVQVLSSRYPEMIGDVIQSDGETLQSPNTFNLNAKRMIPADQMDQSPKDDDRIILMSISAGG